MSDPSPSSLHERLVAAYEQWLGNMVDPREAWDDGGEHWLPLGADRDARHASGPAFRSEQELAELRGECRALATNNEFAINGHENRVSYIVGAGHVYRVAAKKQAAAPADLSARVQQVLDRFLRDNDWHARQQELVLRVDRDGEAFVRWFVAADGTCRLRFVEPSQIATPRELAADPAHSFGVHTDPLDVETVLGYHVDGQYVDAAAMQHRKANVDRNVKRGLPLFFPVRKNLRRAEKLLRNMSTVAEIQSAIALVRRHRASRAGVEPFLAQSGDAGRPASRGQGPTRHAHFAPGTILDVHAEVDYDFPAAALDAGSYVAVLQAELRAIAARLVMPEFMLTSDASNANYASTMVAEGPAVRMFERLQRQLVAWDRELLHRAVAIAAHGGLLPADALEQVEIVVAPPSLVVRDKLDEARAWRIAHEAGILSAQTWSQRLGLDYEQEQANRRGHAA